MSVAEKKEFVMKHVFTDVMNMKPCEERIGKKENYFNVPWVIQIYKRHGDGLHISLCCLKFSCTSDWSINATVNMKLLNKTEEESLVKSFKYSQKIQSYKIVKEIGSADMEKYLVDGELTVEMNVKITKMSGVEEKLSNFDESINALPELVLMVNDEKRHVLKKTNFSKMSATQEKTFLLKHVFTNVMDMKQGKDYFGTQERHFNVRWVITTFKIEESILIYLTCLYANQTDDWSIEAEIELKLLKNGKEEFFVVQNIYRKDVIIGNNLKEIKIEELQEYLGDGNLTVECYVKVTKINGQFMEYSRCFDESTKKFSDVVLLVKDEKFYVLKKYLELHSSVFESLFMGNFEESKQSEHELNDIEPYDFQNFLEVLHGDPAINDESRVGIRKLAIGFGSETVFRQLDHKNKSNAYQKLRSFDGSTKKFSDVVLIVKDKRFYVLKMYLASHSTYFESLFMGNFKESKQPEIELRKINPHDFQNFLEVIYGEPALMEDTVKGILHLSNMYDATLVTRQCEKFLIAYSKKPLKMKFEMATKYNMVQLKNKCISEMSMTDNIT